MKIQELIDLVALTEKKQLQNYSKKKNYFDIAPIDSNGSPLEDATARPTIVFDVYDDELAIKWIYLNERHQGLGTKIIQWLIDYSAYINVSRVSIRLVGCSNEPMKAVATKLGFLVIGSRGNSFDYGLLLKEESNG